MNYYRKKPDAFVSLAHELWPGLQFKPTLTHKFLKVLSDKGLLLRIYSQNIDGLEFLAGIPEDKLVECHGHFRTASCIDCHRVADPEAVKKTIVEDGKTPLCNYCGGNVKPDIVFFGEQLPDKFYQLLKKDLPQADLLMIMGTSLNVAPVSQIPNMVRCNRVLFNRDLVMRIRKGRDSFVEGDCDSNVQKLMDKLNWSVEPQAPEEETEEDETSKEDEKPEENLDQLFSKIDINDDKKKSAKSSEKKDEKDK